jgi:DNA recombination protein RmuC
MDVLTTVIAFCLGTACGALFGGMLVYRRARTARLVRDRDTHAQIAVLQERLENRARENAAMAVRLSTLESEKAEKNQALSAAAARTASLETQLDQERKQASEKLGLLNEARDQLRLEFQNLAHRIFDEKSRIFVDQNRTNLDRVLMPFRDQIKDFGTKVEQAYHAEARERHSLRQEVVRLQELNQQIQEDAVNLTAALKGHAKTQGTWGEIVLERLLEQSGLRKGREYVVQCSYRNTQGRQSRPDIVVHLPDSKDIVIDSKVSLTAYERYVNAVDQESRLLAVRQHMASLHAHLKELQGKEYENLPQIRSLDFVLMFVPVEGAFTLALEEDENIFQRAFEENLMIVSPSTLLVTLRTIQNIWRHEYQNRNALEIARQAGNLYDHFVRFVDDLEKVGEFLGKSRLYYEQAHRRLATGKGNLVRRAENLRELGVQVNKILPSDILEGAHLDIDGEKTAPVISAAGENPAR